MGHAQQTRHRSSERVERFDGAIVETSVDGDVNK